MQQKSKKYSFKEAAVKILEEVDEPLSPKEIAVKALASGLLVTEGKTPEASMGAQLYVDVSRNPKSKFKKVGKGRFSLKKQTESASSPLLIIDRQNSIVKAALMERLFAMDPFHFEILLADLLEKIGYENVEVTKRSGDRGIDIVANLTMEGITNVRTIIQAKRYARKRNVPGKIIRQMRGSAETDQRGLVITTSDFTKEAVIESEAVNKTPVSLINGEKLLELLVRYGVGIKKEEVTLYSLENEYFDIDTSEEKRKAAEGKNRSIWPLPGGTSSYVDTLFSYLDKVSLGGCSREDLIKWYISNYDNVKSENTANGYVNVPRNMGLTSSKNGIIVLTEDGVRIQKSKDLDVLYEVISKNILAFDDIVEFIITSKAPVSEKTVLNYLKENFDIEWSTYAQVNFRLLWLVNLQKIKKTDFGYIGKVK